jgi:iron complex outermembrane recepter protein
MKKFFRKRPASLITLTGCLSLSLTATGAESASTTSPESENRSLGSALMEEVVVISRKRAVSESLQDVPVAASAYGREQMNAVFAEDIADLGALAPNVNIESGGTQAGVSNIFIRGMGLSGTTPSDEPAAGIIQDGVFWGVNYGALGYTYDLESVEILRGPQGTLFGRNVTAGAISIRSARPSGDFGFGIEGTAGSNNRRDIAGFFEAPLIDNQLSVRIAAQKKSSDGFVDNLTTGNDHVGDVDARTIRAVLVYDPTEEIDITLIAERYTDNSDSSPTYRVLDPNRKKFTTTQGLDGGVDSEVNLYVLEANWELPHGIVTSVSGYRDVTAVNTVDADGTPNPVFHILFSMDGQEQFSQEIRYASTFSDTYRFTVGAYYFEQEWDYEERRNEVINANSQSALNHNSAAVFADLDYTLSEQLSLNIGGRFTTEEKEARTAGFGDCDPDQDIVLSCVYGPEDEDSADWNNFSPKVGLSYRPNDQWLWYGSYTRGFRSGGFTLRGSALTTPYDEEIVDAYELGFKADLADGKVRLNTALFYNQYDDLQRTVTDPVTTIQTTLNAAQATIYGLEAELTAQLAEGLFLNFNYGYTNASYEDFKNFDINGDGVIDPEAKNLDFARVPEHQFLMALTHETGVFDGFDLISRLSYAYTDDMVLDDNNLVEQDSYEDVSASIKLIEPDNRWNVSLFGKNLTNEEHFSWGLALLGGIGWGVQPRTWGLKVEYNY